MHSTDNNFVSLRDCLRIVFRHRRRATVTFALVMTTVMIAALVWPKGYVSEAKLFIRIGRTSVALDPTATVGQTVAMSDTRERELNSALEILRSRELLNSVVQEVGAQAIITQDPALVRPESGPAVDPAALRILHQGIDKLEKMLQENVARNSNVITVSCSSSSPELAQTVLRAYVQSFKEHYTRLHRTSGSYEFFVNQAVEVKQQLADAEAELRDAKNRVGVSSIVGEQKLLDQRLTALQKELIDTSTALAASRSNLTTLQQQHPDVHLEDLSDTVGPPPQEIASMRTELFKLEILERERVANLSSTHPKVIAIRDQVREARALYGRQKLLSEKTNTSSLQAKLAELEKQSEETKAKLLRLNETEIRINSLSQTVAGLAKTLKTYEEHREQARVDGAMASQQISDVNVAQAPTFNPKHVTPKKSIILVLGFLAATFAALVVIMAAEFFDDSFQIPEQVEACLKLPVILCVPQTGTVTLARS